MVNWSSDLDFKERDIIVEKIKDFSLKFTDVFDKIIIFGSTARGEATTTSDIDIYVESDSLTTTQFARSKELREFCLGLYKIGVDTHTEFDILSFGRNELKALRSSLLWKQIEKDGVILYAKDL